MDVVRGMPVLLLAAFLSTVIGCSRGPSEQPPATSGQGAPASAESTPASPDLGPAFAQGRSDEPPRTSGSAGDRAAGDPDVTEHARDREHGAGEESGRELALIPPLRERPEDVEPLARYFLEQLTTKMRRPARTISKPALAMLERYAWPGNVRELKNVIERAVILEDSAELLPEHLPDELKPGGRAVGLATGLTLPAGGIDLERLEQDLLRQALEQAGGQQDARGGVAGPHLGHVAVPRPEVRAGDRLSVPWRPRALLHAAPRLVRVVRVLAARLRRFAAWWRSLAGARAGAYCVRGTRRRVLQTGTGALDAPHPAGFERRGKRPRLVGVRDLQRNRLFRHHELVSRDLPEQIEPASVNEINDHARIQDDRPRGSTGHTSLRRHEHFCGCRRLRPRLAQKTLQGVGAVPNPLTFEFTPRFTFRASSDVGKGHHGLEAASPREAV